MRNFGIDLGIGDRRVLYEIDEKAKVVRIIRVRLSDKVLIFLFLAGSCLPACGEDSACKFFYDKLIDLPHTKLTLKTGAFESLLDRKAISGCQVEFRSHASQVPGEKVFERFESLTHTPGWVTDKVADGPGTSTVVIEREKRRCFLHWSQPSWVDEESKEIKQSEDIELIIQCLHETN